MKDTNIKSNVEGKSTPSQKNIKNVDNDMNNDAMPNDKIKVNKLNKIDEPAVKTSNENQSRSSGKMESVGKAPVQGSEKMTKDQAASAASMGQVSHKVK